MDSNEASRQFHNLPNGFIKSEQLHGFESSLLGSLPPSTSMANAQMSNLNRRFLPVVSPDFVVSDMLLPGISKTAVQVANFMRNSQAPPLEIQQVLMQDPRLALILNQALTTMNTAIDPIADGRSNAAISNLMDHVGFPFVVPLYSADFRNLQCLLDYHIPLFRV